LDRAVPLIVEAHQLASSDKLDNPYYQIHTLRISGQIAWKKKMYEKAAADLQSSLEIARHNNISVQSGLTLLALAELQLELTKFTTAETLLKEAEAIFLHIDNNYLLSKTRELLKELK